MKSRTRAITAVTTAMFAGISAATFHAVAPTAALAADSGTVSPMHNITCSWSHEFGPHRLGTAVQGTVGVDCTDRLDDAHTSAQLQIFDYDLHDYRAYGNPVVSYSTSTNIRVTDGAPGRTGTWRTRGDHFGQHGNIFSLPTWYSDSTVLTFG